MLMAIELHVKELPEAKKTFNMNTILQTLMKNHGTFKQRMFEDSLDTTECLYHVGSIVVQIPQLAVVPLMRPPERILFQNLNNYYYKIKIFKDIVNNFKLYEHKLIYL